MNHIPVLLKEVKEILDLKDGMVVIDATAGGGGHAEEILKNIGPEGKLFLVDWDHAAVELLKEKMKNSKNVIYLEGNYADLPELMKENNFPKTDCLLLDLGFSSDQLENRGRGFSFLKEEPLLMTYNNSSQSLENFLANVSLNELTEVISKYGEEKFARKIAETIFKNRQKITNTKVLAQFIKSAVPISYERGRIHPATRTFQAFRIYLNGELDNLEKLLNSLGEILKPGGRVAIISFHSLEDRIVKNSFNQLFREDKAVILTKKPITASPEEILANPRSRSAKMRGIILKK